MIQIQNVTISDLDRAIRASKFPMAADVNGVSTEMTKRQKALAQVPSGTGHDCFLKGITVAFDLTATNKMWIQLQRYHFGDIVSSQSTMHRLSKIDLEEALNIWVDPFIVERMKILQETYRLTGKPEDELRLLYSCPSGLKITARYVTNYLQLKTIYHQRKNHRLPEWKEFCAWVESLPRFKELVLGDEE